MADPIDRRVALITGCGKKTGIGNAIALALSGAGVAVAVADVAPRGTIDPFPMPNAASQIPWGGLDDLVAEIRAAGGEAIGILGDVSNEADAQRLVDETVAHYGRLDILVNNAAAPQGDDTNDIAEVPLAAWDRVMGINARGTFLMCRAAVPHMRTRGWGRIINMSSMAGKKGMKRLTVYSGSKAAIIGMTRSMAIDVAPSGITVNAVCPGHVRTSRGRSQLSPEEVGNIIPAGRYGEPGDIAGLVAYLASDVAGFLTAQAISVDGGELPAAG